MPYSRARYTHNRQKSPGKFIESTFKTVPLNHTRYSGKRYKPYMRSGTKAKAIVGKLKSNGKWSIQSILIPRRLKS